MRTGRARPETPRRGTRTGKPVTPADVQQTVTNARMLIELCEREPELLEQTGVPASALEDLRDAAIQAPRELRIPTATEMLVSALTSPSMDKHLVLTLYHRTLRAIHALAPIVAVVLARKLDDDQAPGSTRVALELAKGIGLLTPAEPIAAKQRMDLMDDKALRSKSDEELREGVLDFT